MSSYGFFKEAQVQMTQLPQLVQKWMLWLNIVFLPALIFAFNHEEARWALVVYVVGFPVGFGFYYFIRDIAILGVPHIILWIPLLVYLVYSTFTDPTFSVLSLFGIWVALLSLTIAISAPLDLKAIVDALGRRG